jgi:hypothetical protein
MMPNTTKWGTMLNPRKWRPDAKLNLRSLALWGIAGAVTCGIALLGPSRHPGDWLARGNLVALATAVLAGAYALGYGVIGWAARRVTPVAAFGSTLLAAGLFLIGLHYLPASAPWREATTGNGLALFIAGIVLQLRAARPA